MSELIKRVNGQPFKKAGAAKTKRTELLKGGVDTEVTEVNGGFALKVIGAENKSVLSSAFGGLPHGVKDTIRDSAQTETPPTPPTPTRERPRRVKISGRNILTAPKREGYVRRIVNDKPGRIKGFLDQGYEIVTGDFPLGDVGTLSDKSWGSVPSKVVDKELGTRAVLMEIPEDWYEEDQQEKEVALKAKEESIVRQTEQEGQYGKVSLGPNKY